VRVAPEPVLARQRDRSPSDPLGRAGRGLVLVLPGRGGLHGRLTGMTDQAPAAAETSRPVLLAVDDEPSVARAVERDLRRRYGRDYRVLRAGSGEDALTAVRESKLRGASV